jgi:hypothetical protein
VLVVVDGVANVGVGALYGFVLGNKTLSQKRDHVMFGEFQCLFGNDITKRDICDGSRFGV